MFYIFFSVRLFCYRNVVLEFFVSAESLEGGKASGRLGSSRVEPEILPVTQLGFKKVVG